MVTTLNYYFFALTDGGATVVDFLIPPMVMRMQPIMGITPVKDMAQIILSCWRMGLLHLSLSPKSVLSLPTLFFPVLFLSCKRMRGVPANGKVYSTADNSNLV